MLHTQGCAATAETIQPCNLNELLFYMHVVDIWDQLCTPSTSYRVNSTVFAIEGV